MKDKNIAEEIKPTETDNSVEDTKDANTKNENTENDNQDTVTLLTRQFEQRLKEKDEEIKKLIKEHKDEVVGILKGLGKAETKPLTEEEQSVKNLIEKINKERRR